MSRQQRTLGVVPLREMEAWTLADRDALRSAFTTCVRERSGLRVAQATRSKNMQG